MNSLKTKNYKLPSNKKFGIFFSIIFLLLGIYFYYIKNYNFMSFFFFVSFIFFLMAIIYARILTPLNISWMYLGVLIGKITNPIILFILYFLIFTPFAILRRIFGKDELSLNKKNVKTYWVNIKKQKDEYNFFNQY